MLEIVLLFAFCGHLASVARRKARSSAWAALGAFGWIGGEVAGAVIAASRGSEGMGLYFGALLGGCVGAIFAYAIVFSLADRTQPDLPAARTM